MSVKKEIHSELAIPIFRVDTVEFVGCLRAVLSLQRNIPYSSQRELLRHTEISITSN